MQLEEIQVNVLFLPAINSLLPEGILIQHITCKENGFEFDMEGMENGERIFRRYTAELADFRFDEAGKYAILNYRKSDLPVGIEDPSGPGITQWLKNNKHIHVSEDRISIQFSQLVVEHPSLKNIEVKSIRFHDGFLDVEVDPPLFSSANGNSEETEKKGELILYELNPEQKRFYDRLREKIEEFIRDKMGDSQSEKIMPYLLLAPDLFVLLIRLIKDPRVEVSAKAIITVAVLYFMTPFDLIPEALLGPIGYIDDIVLAVFALKKIIGEVDESILLEHWNGKQNLLQVIQDVIEKADELVGSKRLEKIRQFLRKKAR